MIDFQALFNVSYGLYIISSGDKNKGNAFIANAFFQVTAEPAQFALCCNKDNFSAPIIKSTKAFSVSILHEEASMDIIGTLGYKSGRDLDKLKNLEISYGETGVPIVKSGCMAVLECKLVNTFEVGTHYIFIGELISAQNLACDFSPITYAYYRNVKKGFAPKNAPTFIDKSKIEQQSTEQNTLNSYKCNVCGYIFSETTENEFDNLTHQWHCPICGVFKDDFSKLT